MIPANTLNDGSLSAHTVTRLIKYCVIYSYTFIIISANIFVPLSAQLILEISSLDLAWLEAGEEEQVLSLNILTKICQLIDQIIMVLLNILLLSKYNTLRTLRLQTFDQNLTISLGGLL